MNITNVKKRTEMISFKVGDEVANVKVYPDEQTPLFEDERRRMIFDNDITGSQLLAYTIGTLVAEWDFVITVENTKPIITRKLDPKNPADVALIPLSILNEITKGVSELNRPGERKEETSNGSFS